MAGLVEPLVGSGTVKMGPFVSLSDGKTPMTDLAIAQADVLLSKNNENYVQKNDVDPAVHDENGWYDVPLDGTDTNTSGHLIVSINKSGALPVWRKFAVASAP